MSFWKLWSPTNTRQRRPHSIMLCMGCVLPGSAGNMEESCDSQALVLAGGMKLLLNTVVALFGKQCLTFYMYRSVCSRGECDLA